MLVLSAWREQTSLEAHQIHRARRWSARLSHRSLNRAARNKIPPLGDWMMLCLEERPYALTTARQARQNRESASQTPTACSSLAGIGIWSDMTARGHVRPDT